MGEYSILFLGDIVGKPGRQAVRNALDYIHNEFAVVAASNEQIASLGNGLGQARLQQA